MADASERSDKKGKSEHKRDREHKTRKGDHRDKSEHKDKEKEKVGSRLDPRIRVLSETRATNHRVTEILKKYPAEEVEEFNCTNLLVDASLQRLLDKPDQLTIELATAQRMQKAVEEFHQHLRKLEEDGKLKRHLTSSHFRGQLEQLNSTLNSEVHVISSELSGAGSETLTAGQRPNFSRMRSFSRPIADDDGQVLWNREFGPQNDQVEWHTFIGAFTAAMSTHFQVTPEDERYLRMVLDNAGTGYVSSYRFSELLKGFGPLKRSVPYMRKVFQEKWFYGFISGEESMRLLAGQPPGTYMVRFSRSKPGSFALQFVFGDGRVLPVLIQGRQPEGLIVKEERNNERKFSTLYEVLEYYKKLLAIPFASALSREAWFHGDLTRDECEEVLKVQKPGTFLVSFGDNVNSYRVSWVVANEQVLHTEIRSDPSGNLPQEQRGTTFAALTDYLRAHRDYLLFNYDSEGIPKLRIGKLEPRIVAQYDGPASADDGGSDGFKDLSYGQSISTYPAGNGGWNIICDRYGVRHLPNWTLLAVADGCNWGRKPQQAALKAALGFMAHVLAQSDRMPDLKEMAHVLLRGFSVAHSAIIAGLKEIFEAGTTTLLGGAIVELADQDQHGGVRYVFICGSVGDCKAFVWSPKKKIATDVTARNRGGSDARDPGGRLGPFLDNGSPDVRNLRCFFEPVEEGDIVALVSDGVHDNLDPKSLGKQPSDFGHSKDAKWDTLSARDVEIIKTKFMNEKLKEILKDAVSPKDVTEALIAYSKETTRACREFMEANPKAKQPSDYKLYPGKIDHTTAVCAVVGKKAD